MPEPIVDKEDAENLGDDYDEYQLPLTPEVIEKILNMGYWGAEDALHAAKGQKMPKIRVTEELEVSSNSIVYSLYIYRDPAEWKK